MNDMTRTDMAVLREQLEALVQRLNSSLPINLSETSNSAKKFIYEHPMLSLMLIILTIMCTIPIISFLCFIIATLCFTFLGFIFVEGTLFTVGTFFLSGVLFIIALFALGFSAVVGVSWVFVNKALKVLNNVSHKLAPKPLPSPPQERNLGTVD